MTDVAVAAISATIAPSILALAAVITSILNGRKVDAVSGTTETIARAVNGERSATQNQLQAANDLIAELRRAVSLNEGRIVILGKAVDENEASRAAMPVGQRGPMGPIGLPGHDVAPDLLERLVLIEDMARERGARITALEKLVRAQGARKTKR